MNRLQNRGEYATICNKKWDIDITLKKKSVYFYSRIKERYNI